MLERALATILVVLTLFTLSFYSRKHNLIKPYTFKDLKNSLSGVGGVGDRYKNASLEELMERLDQLCAESKFGQVGVLVGLIRDKADLVITGRMVHAQTQTVMANLDDVSGELCYTVSVENVNRGNYSNDTIDIWVGAYDNKWPAANYPVWLKTRYSTGAPIRAYLNRDYESGKYFAPACFFSFEPLEERSDE